MPIKSDIGAVELLVFEERIKAVRRRAIITPKDITVRIFSARVQAETTTPELPELLFWPTTVEITGLPKLFRRY